MKNKTLPQGLSTLLMVFIISSLMALIVLIIQLSSLLAAKRASQVQQSQIAFFAAEGSLYETLQLLKENPAAELDGLNGKYLWGEERVTIKRKVSEDNGLFTIELTAASKGAKRKLSAQFALGQTGTQRYPLDIVLALDLSASLESNNDSVLNQVKTAATDFLNNSQFTKEDQIGIVTQPKTVDNSGTEDQRNYDRCFIAEIKKTLTPLDRSGHDEITSLINNLAIEPEGSTNLGDALVKSREVLDRSDRNSTKVIILFTDGLTNRLADSAERISCIQCSLWPCLDTSTGNEYLPDQNGKNVGNRCSDELIDLAKEAKENDIHIFTIFFRNIDKSQCHSGLNRNPLQKYFTLDDPATIDSPTQLGRLTLQQTASKEEYALETGNINQLSNLFEDIANHITSPGFLSISEQLPE